MSYIDSFTVLASSPVDRTYGFAPGAAIVWMHSNTSATDSVAAADIVSSFGVIGSGSNQAVVAIRNDSADAFNRPISNGSTSGLALDVTNIGTPDGEVSGSFLANGLRCTVTNLFTTARRVHVLALPASRIASSAVGQFTVPNGSTSVGVTVGFAADVVLFFRQFTSAGTAAALMIGAASRAGTVSDVCSLFRSRYVSGAPSDTESYSRAGESLVGSAAGAKGSVTSWSSSGFITSWTGTEGIDMTFSYLALQAATGFAFDIAAGTTLTDTSGFALPFTKVRPDSGLIISCCQAESSFGTPSAHARLNIGAFAEAGTSAQFASSIFSRDAVSSSSTANAVDYDSVYANIALGATTLDGEMGLSSAGNRQLNLVMSNADPSGAFFWSLASGVALPAMRGAPIFF